MISEIVLPVIKVSIVISEIVLPVIKVSTVISEIVLPVIKVRNNQATYHQVITILFQIVAKLS